MQMKPTELNGERSIQYILDDSWKCQRIKEKSIKAYIRMLCIWYLFTLMINHNELFDTESSFCAAQLDGVLSSNVGI